MWVVLARARVALLVGFDVVVWIWVPEGFVRL